VLFNANRSGKLPYPELEAILPQVAALNRQAIETALKFEVHACTDVTGFGILGHTLELARGSHVQIDLIYENLPFYPNALRMYQKGETTGSNKANRKLAEGAWEIATLKTAEEQALLFDPQTSGGLLLAVPETQADDLIARLKKEGVETAVRVGEVVAGERPYIRVV
jgi:selenide,water dikinase